jgi:hypothetical protein
MIVLHYIFIDVPHLIRKIIDIKNKSVAIGMEYNHANEVM